MTAVFVFSLDLADVSPDHTPRPPTTLQDMIDCGLIVITVWSFDSRLFRICSRNIWPGSLNSKSITITQGNWKFQAALEV